MHYLLAGRLDGAARSLHSGFHGKNKMRKMNTRLRGDTQTPKNSS
jgi:hypothetical protein